MEHSRKKLDLTGQRFGKLTVLAPAENIGARTAWLCRCDCGKEAVVKTYHLRNGHTKSCGCLYGPGGPRSGLGLTYIDGTCVEMIQAKTVRRNNTSGVPGVDWRASKGLWRAMICFKGKRYYLGSYRRFEDAVKARKEAEARLHDSFLQQYDAQTAQTPPGDRHSACGRTTGPAVQAPPRSGGASAAPVCPPPSHTLAGRRLT